MTPHKQKLFGFGAGDCFRTCIASILDLDPESVPNFCERDTWYEDCVQWLKKRGIGVMYFEERGHTVNCYAIVSGRSPRWKQMAEQHPDVDPSKFLHSVVAWLGDYGEKDEPVHDPHPDNAFIETFRDWMVLVPSQVKPT
jgi:hypothetical protein